MTENEYKTMLTKKEFNTLKKFLNKTELITQRNYYYDTAELLLYKLGMTLRVREINNVFQLQYKSKSMVNNGVHTRQEKEWEINNIPFLIKLKQYSVSKIKEDVTCIGNMLTLRYIKTIDGLDICLDENHYLGYVDYELELECKDKTLIAKWLEENSEVLNIINNKTGKSKYQRWIEAYKKNKNNDIFTMFSEIAKNNLDMAIVDENENLLTYKELLELSTKLSSYILSNYAYALSLNEPIGILMHKSYKQIVVMLASLQLGIPFLPLDTNYPIERNKYMLNNSNTSLVICDNVEQASNINTVTIVFDNIFQHDSINNESIFNKTTFNNIAYVLYTSGSTGLPKGVVIRQDAILNTLLWRIKYYELNPFDRVLQMLSISFDSSIEDIFCSLLSGGCIVLVNQNKKLNIKYLVSLIEKYKITYFLTVPSYYKFLLEKLNQNYCLNKVILAGEIFYNDLVKKHFEVLNNVRLFNEYGPTENSVCTTVSEVLNPNEITIGKPIDNVFVKLINEDAQGIGELAISGAGLFDGYLNDVELTQKKTQYDEGVRWYLTGDLVKYDANKNLVFIGRNDYQIKINGKKFNLSEIDEALIDCPRVVFSKSIYEKTNDVTIIITFIKYKDSVDKQTAYNEINQFLKCCLPCELLPHKFVFVDKIPLLNNGKVNVIELKKLI